jgi:hypothetical protein
MTSVPPEPERADLRLYGSPSEHDALPWTWVDSQLGSAATYWVVARTPGHPHPRPVWGVWRDYTKDRRPITTGGPSRELRRSCP